MVEKTAARLMSQKHARRFHAIHCHTIPLIGDRANLMSG
jgi:hypothetical protein